MLSWSITIKNRGRAFCLYSASDRMENQTSNGILYYANDWLNTLAEHETCIHCLFRSRGTCWNVLLNIGGFYDQINATEGHCDVSEVASHIVRPKLRPW